MLLLLYQVKNSHYGLDSAQVLEVIPKVFLKKIPHTPDYVAGVFNYHGVIVPVIDLCSLLSGKPCAERLGTRILLVNYHTGKDETHVLGLMAERVTETIKVSEDAGISSGIDVEKASYLGDIVTEGDEMIQIVEVDNLLPESLKKTLFTDERRDK